MEEKEKKKLAEKLEAKKTTELIDYLDTADDVEIDTLYDEIESRGFFAYLQEQISENRKDIDKMQSEFRKDIEKLSDRLDKIDNFWNISNKLEMILDRLQKRPYRSHKKNI